MAVVDGASSSSADSGWPRRARGTCCSRRGGSRTARSCRSGIVRRTTPCASAPSRASTPAPRGAHLHVPVGQSIDLHRHCRHVIHHDLAWCLVEVGELDNVRAWDDEGSEDEARLLALPAWWVEALRGRLHVWEDPLSALTTKVAPGGDGLRTGLLA
jgi:hypothetical protein